MQAVKRINVKVVLALVIALLIGWVVARAGTIGPTGPDRSPFLPMIHWEVCFCARREVMSLNVE